ncbi:hypothetical protein NIES4103_54280 [Nostoc sp. NIES-4103]|nr:hypothetical protein NIES4103_54280 [Nostoc sp. NIES-4103]
MLSQHSTVNNQQLSFLRNQVFFELSQFFSLAQLEGVKNCATKLKEVLPIQSHLQQNKVLVAYGGGKDSSYMLTFVRMVQLFLFKKNGETFQIRVATNRHGGMPNSVMENIHRVYCALQLYDDPDVELLLIDGNKVSSFDPRLPLPHTVIEQNRQDILMTGHRTQAASRPTFCNACNISMVNSFGVASCYQGGVDVIITGDSRKEQRAYMLWVNRLAQKLNPNLLPHGHGFRNFLKTLDIISQSYFSEIYGEKANDQIEAHKIVADELALEPLFFSIYNYTEYAVGDHWELLTKYLGFEFDELAFSFSESDCANPALMAHLRGLKCQHVYGRTYVEGIEEYVKFAICLMRQKHFPDFLIDQISQRYSNEEAIKLMRQKINAFALESFGITEEQLICMVYAPFSEKGRNLETYLIREQPHLLPDINKIHKLLERKTESEISQQANDIASALHDITGLNLAQLITCYDSPMLGSNHNGKSDIVNLILDRDPHKGIIETRHSPNGSIVYEMISGR